MIRRTGYLLALSFLLVGCGSSRSAGDHYRAHGDYRSLHAVSRHLAVGMPESEIESLLGEPEYWPTESQCYYGSDRRVPMDPILNATYTLVIEYTRQNESPGRVVADWFLGPISE